MCIVCFFNGNMLFLVSVCAKVVLTFEGFFFLNCSIAYLDMLCCLLIFWRVYYLFDCGMVFPIFLVDANLLGLFIS